MPAQTPAELHRMFQQAVNDGAVDALVALYEPEPAFATRAGDPAVGGTALRAHLAGLLAARPHFDRVATTKVFETGDIALTCSDWSATATDAHGATVAMSGRGTEVARRQPDGTWLLVIDNPWGTR
ncbi:ketosteroid isomerase-like protein [Streptacidiphilus sp. MAP12-20]|uniref:YybH family protein n=1 Tax=Streptacidiphilus sp. MAP12-20 TaxID=3156299 RepID=UPI00351522CE